MDARRRALVASAALVLPTWPRAAEPFAAMTDGPFYPPPRWRADRLDWDADLTRVAGQPAAAQGEHLGLTLALKDTRGLVVDGAEVEIWQCDARAQYRHPSVRTPADRVDPGFQGFGATRSGRDGQAVFRTIRPVPYPGRTPHIHVKLRHPSFGERVSQLFVAGDPGNDRDFLWRQLDADEQRALSMALRPADDDGLRWTSTLTLTVPA